MKTFKLLALSGLVAVTCISPAIAHDDKSELQANSASAGALPSKTTTSFINNAAIGGLFEVESSKLALDKAQDPAVKDFARKMISDHGKANEELKSTVSAANIGTDKVPSDLDAKHQATLDKLNATPAESSDKAFIKAQTDAHNEAVTLFNKYSKSGDNKTLKDFATNTLPTLQEHKAMLPALKAGK